MKAIISKSLLLKFLVREYNINFQRSHINLKNKKYHRHEVIIIFNYTRVIIIYII